MLPTWENSKSGSRLNLRVVTSFKFYKKEPKIRSIGFGLSDCLVKYFNVSGSKGGASCIK